MTEPAFLVFCGALLVILFMFILWLWHFRLKNAAIVDPGWAVAIVLLGAVYFAGAQGYFLRKALIFFMVFFWGTRLAWHLAVRMRHEPGEDTRYQKMRRDMGSKASFYFLLFFEFQVAVAVILSLPFLISSIDPAPGLRVTEIAAVFLWLISTAGESLADLQLKGFKADPVNKGKVCEAGLWNYSRHPNYFFECLIWVSYFLFAAASPGGIWAVLSPALMIFFITSLSGVPPAEEASIRSRGDAYRRYQKTTSVLIPWFKKK